MSTSTTEAGALIEAVESARHAPSIFNTQPWQWHFAGEELGLYTDPSRALPVVDPDGRLAMVSCGVALHHARTALMAGGWSVAVQRLPEDDEPELLARIRVVGQHWPDQTDIARYEAIASRHTDRRPFADTPVPDDAWERLRGAAEPERAHLHLLGEDDIELLASAAGRAQEIEMADSAYRAELYFWTHRPPEAQEGVAEEIIVVANPRRVPVRDFGLGGTPAGPARQGAGTGPAPRGGPADRHARYAILFAESDDRIGWLHGGEALSAVLLQSAVEGLSVSPMSDVTEVVGTRVLLRDVLSSVGYPLLALRIGVAQPEPTARGAHPSGVPRRPISDVLDT